MICAQLMQLTAAQQIDARVADIGSKQARADYVGDGAGGAHPLPLGRSGGVLVDHLAGSAHRALQEFDRR